jgi:seryl-tRNA synthetase
MLDIQFIRENKDVVAEKSKQKGADIDVDKLISLDDDRRALLKEVEVLRQRKNENANKVKQVGGKPDEAVINEGKQIKVELTHREDLLRQTEAEWLSMLKQVPNMPLDDVPIGSSEDDNVVVKTIGDKPVFDFAPKNHAEIAEAKGWLDKERAAKVAGTRFAYLMGDLVLLDWAMNMFALSKLTDRRFIETLVSENNLDLPPTPFIPVQPPAVAKTVAYDATGRLNKEEQTYKLAEDDLWLNASAEHTMAPMYLGEIIPEQQLPLRYVGYTTAFRREAGTYGKDMEGFLRLHQFNKLEMETFSAPEASHAEHLLMVAVQEYLMQQLGLPYQVVLKCTADIGGPNARGVDIDVWLPGQNKYRETHTADLITDYQARRMNTRLRRADGSIDFVHTNDGTAFSQRPLIGIIENYQTKEGNVVVPEVLRPYMGGREQI